MHARAHFVTILTTLVLSIGLGETPAQRLRALQEQAGSILDGGRVLVLTLAPGREDLATVAYYRAAHQAQVRVAYLSNGEATIADDAIRYPHQVAAELRRLAALSTEQIGAEHRFLNLPHPDGVAADSTLRTWWPADSLREGLRREIEEFLPDLVLVDGLDRPEVPPSVPKAVRSALEELLKRARSMRRFTPSAVVMSSLSDRGVRAWLGRISSAPVKKSMTHAGSIDSLYAVWRGAVPYLERTYTSLPLYPPERRQNVADLRLLLRRPVPTVLMPLDSQLRAYARNVRLWKALPRGIAVETELRQSVLLLGLIDQRLRSGPPDDALVRRTLLDWRSALEDIRLALLDPEIYWRVSDSVLTNLQLAYLTIDSIRGLDPQGQTQVFFPMAQRGWIVNEGTSHVVPLVPGTPYRILAGRNLSYDMPRELAGLQQRQFRAPWYFFVVHQSTSPERSFSCRLDAGFLGAPRFSVDVLWPMAFVSAGEEVVVRLTNQSRDGVRDSLRIQDGRVEANPMFFRLSAKGSSVTDTMSLRFSEDIPEGTHLGPLSISGQEVGRFIYRKFSIAVDSLRSLVLLGSSHNTVGGQTLRRLGVRYRALEPLRINASDLRGADVAFLPEWSGSALSPAAWAHVRSFVEQGGHLVVLPQLPAVIQALPDVPIGEALADGTTDSTSAIRFDRTHAIFSAPNDLSAETWEGWLNRRVPHRLKLRKEGVRTLATVGPESLPAILAWKVGQGRVTYVNLNLQHQFLNVHPAAYRLLANLLAERP